jgi:hypothetical protein
MGGGRWTIVLEVLVPEALPGLLAGLTVTMIRRSVMAETIGAGRLGDLAIRYGYQRFNTGIMFGLIAVLTVLVSPVQAGPAHADYDFTSGHALCASGRNASDPGTSRTSSNTSYFRFTRSAGFTFSR